MANFLISTIALSSILLSCSQVNTQSRDHYRNQSSKKKNHFSINSDKFRHGLVPIPYTETKKVPSQKELDKKSVAKGALLYKQHCFKCHGVNADGNGPETSRLTQKPKSLIAIARKVPNFKLYMMVSQWKGEMPGWKSMLNEDETIHLKNYIISLVKKESN